MWRAPQRNLIRLAVRALPLRVRHGVREKAGALPERAAFPAPPVLALHLVLRRFASKQLRQDAAGATPPTLSGDSEVEARKRLWHGQNNHQSRSYAVLPSLSHAIYVLLLLSFLAWPTTRSHTRLPGRALQTHLRPPLPHLAPYAQPSPVPFASHRLPFLCFSFKTRVNSKTARIPPQPRVYPPSTCF